ncbi:MAG: hypothetical protein JWM09_1089 [Francisellaceae bacterium]|nr:hypothetical protein [Francisellaceae bacterium]
MVVCKLVNTESNHFMQVYLFLLLVLLSPIIKALTCEDFHTQFGVMQVIPPKPIPSFTNDNQNAQAQFWKDFQNLENNTDLNIYLTSLSEVKLKALKFFIKNNSIFKNKNVTYFLIKTDSNIANQPIGIAMAEEGAKNRIKDAKKTLKDRDAHHLFVSIENYIEFNQKDKRAIDRAFIILENSEGTQLKYISYGIELPISLFLEAYQKGLDLTFGDLLHNKFNLNPQNWQGCLTNGKMDRIMQIAQTLLS